MANVPVAESIAAGPILRQCRAAQTGGAPPAAESHGGRAAHPGRAAARERAATGRASIRASALTPSAPRLAQR